jgi:hypothetical protein
MSDVRMATRDASWYDHPDVRSPKVWHVVVAPAFMAACDSRVPLVEETETSLSATSAGMRCRRRGCLSRWKAAESSTTESVQTTPLQDDTLGADETESR